jgi:hypothetical protein
MKVFQQSKIISERERERERGLELPNRMSLRPDLLWLTLNLALIIQSLKKLHGLSPRANYTDRATATCRRSDCQLVRIEGATWSA